MPASSTGIPGLQCRGGNWSRATSVQVVLGGTQTARKSHTGVQLQPPGSLSAETAVVEDAAQAWPLNYKITHTQKI